MRDVALSLLVSGSVIGVLAVSGAAGAVTNIGPFTGGAIETFESKAPGYVGPFSSTTGGPEPIFGGAGILSGTTTSTINPLYIWDSTGGLSLGVYGSAVPHDGTKGLVLNPYGAYNGRIDFPTPVDDFGGYWAHASYQGTAGPISWTFYDAGGGVIGADSYNYPGTTLAGVREWRGWNSTTPIAAAEWTGYCATCDSLRINIPSPGVGAFACVGVIGVARRRRRTVA